MYLKAIVATGLLAASVLLPTTASAVLGCQAGYVNATCRDGTLNCCMPANKFDCGDGTNNSSFEDCENRRTRVKAPIDDRRKIKDPTCDANHVYNPRSGRCEYRFR